MVEVGFLVALRVLRVEDVTAIGRRIREIISLVADCQLDRPAAGARNAPDVVAAGNVRLEIDMLTVNRPAKSEHGTRVVQSINVQRTVGWIGWASDRIAGQFRGRCGDHLAREGN